MQDVVDLATSEPPPLRYTLDDIVSSGQRVQRCRQRRWVTCGAAAVVALGVAAAVTVPSLHSGASSRPTALNQAGQGTIAQGGSGTGTGTTNATANFPVPAGPAYSFTFSGYRVGKLRVAAPIDVSTAYQIASVYSDDLTTNDKATNTAPTGPTRAGGTLYAYLTVYRPGAYDPSKLANAQHVTVAGRPALEADNPSNIWAGNRVLAVEYGANAWAVFTMHSSQADNPSAADVRALAAGLPAATPAVAKIPITMSYVPSGYHLDEVGVHAMSGLNGIAGARDGDYAGLLFSRPAQPTTGLTAPFGGEDGTDPPGSFSIFVVPSANSNQKASAGVSCLTGFCNRWADGGTVNIQVSSGGRLSNTEMKKILNGITLGNVHNDATWTDVTTAIH